MACDRSYERKQPAPRQASPRRMNSSVGWKIKDARRLGPPYRFEKSFRPCARPRLPPHSPNRERDGICCRFQLHRRPLSVRAGRPVMQSIVRDRRPGDLRASHKCCNLAAPAPPGPRTRPGGSTPERDFHPDDAPGLRKPRRCNRLRDADRGRPAASASQLEASMFKRTKTALFGKQAPSNGRAAAIEVRGLADAAHNRRLPAEHLSREPCISNAKFGTAADERSRRRPG